MPLFMLIFHASVVRFADWLALMFAKLLDASPLRLTLMLVRNTQKFHGSVATVDCDGMVVAGGVMRNSGPIGVAAANRARPSENVCISARRR